MADAERGRLVQCYSPDGCDQWYWEGRQERPHLIRFPTSCRVHNPQARREGWVAEVRDTWLGGE